MLPEETARFWVNTEQVGEVGGVAPPDLNYQEIYLGAADEGIPVLVDEVGRTYLICKFTVSLVALLLFYTPAI